MTVRMSTTSLCITLCLGLAPLGNAQTPTPASEAAPREADRSGPLEAIVQQAYLKASNPGILDVFGHSVAVDGDTVVVGAPWEDSAATNVDGDQADDSKLEAGAVYVFVRESSGAWTQQAYLKAPNTDGGDSFGWSVDLSGDTLVVGAPRERSSTTGVNQHHLNNSALRAGAAYVFIRHGSAWNVQAYLKASNTTRLDEFGYSVAASGDTVVVGAPGEGSSSTGVNGSQENLMQDSGAGYVFVRTGTTWTQQAFLKASNNDTSMIFAADRFAQSVDISGDTILVGAPGERSAGTGVDGDQSDDSLPSAGAGYIFVRNGSTWSQQAYLKASNTGGNDLFGFDVGLSGDTAVVGAPGERSTATGIGADQDDDSLSFAGAAYVFVRDGDTWAQQVYLKADATDTLTTLGDRFGFSVDLSGDTLAVACGGDDSGSAGVGGDPFNNNSNESGAAYAYQRHGTTWIRKAYVKAGVPDQNDAFGDAVAVSGRTLVVGATGESSGGTGVNGDPTDNSVDRSGAAYVIDLDAWTDLGGAAPGVAGAPRLIGSGDLEPGSAYRLSLFDAPPNALMLASLSFDPVAVDVAGGTLHAFPSFNDFLLLADPTGSFSQLSGWPPDLEPGTNVWFQFVVADASVPGGLTLSNGLLATTP